MGYTIAEVILPRSLPLVVYALKGCLPELEVKTNGLMIFQVLQNINGCLVECCG
jgi:hypothetical protein